jgi:hypothetical protein
MNDKHVGLPVPLPVSRGTWVCSGCRGAPADGLYSSWPESVITGDMGRVRYSKGRVTRDNRLPGGGRAKGVVRSRSALYIGLQAQQTGKTGTTNSSILEMCARRTDRGIYSGDFKQVGKSSRGCGQP